MVYHEAELSRILSVDVDNWQSPIALEEPRLISIVVQRLRSAFWASESGIKTMIGEVGPDKVLSLSLSKLVKVCMSSQELEEREFGMFLDQLNT